MAPTPGSRSRKRRPRTPEPEVKRVYPEFDIPYFAHQQLDPIEYGLSIGLPVGKPGWNPVPKETTTATNGDWVDNADALLGGNFDIASENDSPRSHTSKRTVSEPQDKNSYKRLKVAGGRPAVAKKVTADLDSDDELIVRMKNAKYLEKDIAQRLADEGRVTYNPKTIGTRWARLRKVLAKRNDEMLDAQMTDWHEGDDDVLYESIRKADAIVDQMKRDADNRKWKIVADQMKSLKPVIDFSQNACRSRYHDLQAGTARPTPESVESPDKEMLRRIQSRREKERRINEDRLLSRRGSAQHENIQGNAWTSKKHRVM